MLTSDADKNFCASNDGAIIGENSKVKKSSSWEDCQKSCQDSDGCQEWSFDESSNCTEFGYPVQIVNTDNGNNKTFSGSKYCLDLVSDSASQQEIDSKIMTVLTTELSISGFLTLTNDLF